MNKQTQLIIKITLVLSLALLTACGTTKSSDDESAVTEQASRVEVTGNKPLASCNRSMNSNLDFSAATVLDNTGKVSNQNIKLKFNFLSTALTTTGYSIRFFKWRVLNNQSQLDATPLVFNTFNLNTKQNTSGSVSVVFANQTNTQTGFYINLNDDLQNPYQVIKAVVYKTDGTIAAQTSLLIPQFLANPADYSLNADGSARPDVLKKLHPLYSQVTSGWASNQFQQNFDQYCF